jgi:hypothetical protein
MHASNEEVRLPDDQVGLVVGVFRMLADVTRTPNTPAPEFPDLAVVTRVADSQGAELDKVFRNKGDDQR